MLINYVGLGSLYVIGEFQKGKTKFNNDSDVLEILRECCLTESHTMHYTQNSKKKETKGDQDSLDR